MNKYCSKCKQEKPYSDFYERKVYRWESERYESYCKPCVRKRSSEFYKKNAEKYRAKERERKAQHGDEIRKKKREYRRSFRNDVIKKYGGKCVCCGETDFHFLAFDHINGGGSKHIKGIGGPHNLIYWLKRNNYPNIVQILCHNCNMAKGMYGSCPHNNLLPASHRG